MILTQVGITGFRNLRHTEFEPGNSFNLLTGANGAGKTSVLEAIHLLSTGHSFRSRKTKELVMLEQDSLSVFAKLFEQELSIQHRAGIQKHRNGGTDLKLDYESLNNMADMTRLLPVKALFPDSHKLIQDGPSVRRQFLDWGLFHVEQSFFNEWKSYKRALDQRNNSLRRQLPDAEIDAWNAELSSAGQKISEYRQLYVEELKAWLTEFQRKFQLPGVLTMQYRPGWKNETPLHDALIVAKDQCRRFRTTTVGPHRAELSIDFNGVSARQIMSRGQQKLLVYALHFAQLGMYCENSNKRPIVLCDDLPAELDLNHLACVLESLAEMKLQTFITSNESIKFPENSVPKVFHVEHGVVQEVVQLTG